MTLPDIKCDRNTVMVEGVTPPYDESIADSEGWFISYSYGNSDGTTWRLERRDEDPLFESDEEAHLHVITKAREGQLYHQSCLAFLREHEPDEYRIVTTGRREVHTGGSRIAPPFETTRSQTSPQR